MKKLLTSVMAAGLSLACLTGAAGAATLTTAPKSFLEEQPWFTQCQLGSTAADAVREAAGTEIALVNWGDVANDLNDGEVTEQEIRNVFTEDRELATAEITPAQLWTILEHSVSQARTDSKTEQLLTEESEFDGFCQISGFSFEYDVTAPEGERVLNVALDSGAYLSKEDTDTLITVAAAEYMLSGGYGYEVIPCADAGITLTDALTRAVEEYDVLPQGDQDRITMLGARQNTIAGVIPTGVLPVGSLVLIGLAVMIGVRKKRLEEALDEGEENVLLYTR